MENHRKISKVLDVLGGFGGDLLILMCENIRCVEKMLLHDPLELRDVGYDDDGDDMGRSDKWKIMRTTYQPEISKIKIKRSYTGIGTQWIQVEDSFWSCELRCPGRNNEMCWRCVVSEWFLVGPYLLIGGGAPTTSQHHMLFANPAAQSYFIHCANPQQVDGVRLQTLYLKARAARINIPFMLPSAVGRPFPPAQAAGIDAVSFDGHDPVFTGR